MPNIKTPQTDTQLSFAELENPKNKERTFAIKFKTLFSQ